MLLIDLRSRVRAALPSVFSWPDATMDGWIGPIIIWDRVLTTGEWAWLYNRGAFRTYAEL